MNINLSSQKITVTRKLMADNKISASFSSPYRIDFNVNDSITIDNEVYYLTRNAEPEKGGADLFKYNLTLESDVYFLLRKRFLLNGKRNFTILGDIRFFIDLILSNINETYPRWESNVDFNFDEKNLTFDGVDCRGALNQIMKEFEAEFNVVNKTIFVAEKISNFTNLIFEYGNGKGLYKISRTNVDSGDTVTRVYGFGGSRNSSDGEQLSLPEKYIQDTSEFPDIVEGEYHNEDIFPSFEGEISSVSGDNNITIPSIDFNLLDYLNPGTTAKVEFKKGDLQGYEFEILDGSYDDSSKSFTLIPYIDEGGNEYPNDSFKPQVGDIITLIDILLPESYKDNAIIRLRENTETFLSQNKGLRVSYGLTFDNRYLQQIGVTLKPGDIVRIIDSDFNLNRFIRISETTQTVEGALLQSFTAKISDYIPIAIMDRVISKVIDNNNNIIKSTDTNLEKARQNTLRNQRLFDKVYDPDGYFNDGQIRPESIETILLSVGAKSQNFQLNNVSIQPNYQSDENRVVISNGVLNHLAIEGGGGFDWGLSSADIQSLLPNESYYLYAVCNKAVSTGVWELDINQRPADGGNVYNFLVGVLFEVSEGSRLHSFTYGNTFINGRELTTGRVQSIDGQSFMDLDTNQFNIGTSSNGIDFGVTSAGQLTIRGAIVQSLAGDTFPLGAYRGQYNGTLIYYKGDKVNYDGSEWIYINNTPSSGNTPMENIYWTISASKGDDGAQGPQGDAFIIDEEGFDADRPSPIGLPISYTYFATDTSLLYFVQDTVPQTWSVGTPFGKGDGIIIEFSTDLVNWHPTFLVGDIYSRWSIENSGIINGPFRIVGENGQDGADGQNGENGQDGGYNEQRFATGINPPSVSNAPNPPNWTLEPPQNIDVNLWSIWAIKRNVDDVLSDYDDVEFSDYDDIDFDSLVNSDDDVVWSAPVNIKGASGASGSDGAILYTWLKYADNDQGDGLSDLPEGKPYIGLAYNKNTPNESNNPLDYLFSKIEGDQGIEGPPGENGESLFTWVRYADDEQGNGLSADPTGKDYIGFAYNKNTNTPTSTPTDYTWSLYRGDQGIPGEPGVDGSDGIFAEYRYAKNGSNSTPPNINDSDLAPSGWATSPPSISNLEYIWYTVAYKTADGLSLVTLWTPPVRISGINGEKGDIGASPVYQGNYNPTTVYYGNANRVDIVKYNSLYYVARTDAGAFTGQLPTNTAYWNSFGANFESVATGLLFAEQAYVENLIVGDLQTSQSGQRAVLQSSDNTFRFYNPNGDQVVLIDDQIDLDSAGVSAGGMRTDNSTGNRTSIISGSGVFSNASNQRFLAAFLGIPTNASNVALLFDRNTYPWGLSAAVAGVDQTTSGNSRSYAGFFLGDVYCSKQPYKSVSISSNTILSVDVNYIHFIFVTSVGSGAYLRFVNGAEGQLVTVINLTGTSFNLRETSGSDFNRSVPGHGRRSLIKTPSSINPYIYDWLSYSSL